MKIVSIAFTALLLFFFAFTLRAEEITIDVSTLECDAAVMGRFDANGNGTLDEDELDAYIDWIESGGDAVAAYTAGASYVIVRNGVPVRRWVYRPGAAARLRRRARIDRDDNPPGLAGGAGTNWENPPGAVGGPGASPDRHPYRYGRHPARVDRDDNPPGAVGGPGTNWENPPGAVGGPGTSPNRRRFRRRIRP